MSDYPKPLIPNTQGLTNSFFFGHICAPFMGTLTQDRLRVTEEGFRTHRASNMSLGLHFLVEIVFPLVRKLQ
ncbi:unnamed protein product [Allacma fusca]|uniref:Uncharacterized protein n=1 Tax=Allacma fusca TaxID=39272 RepID=A0A8J2J4R7_9HEXA|nr:unnamed protein product [Allacma fusca]